MQQLFGQKTLVMGFRMVGQGKPIQEVLAVIGCGALMVRGVIGMEIQETLQLHLLIQLQPAMDS